MSQDTEAVAVVRRVLGTDILGAYLYGSAAQDGLQPHSDVDVLVVSRRRTTAQQRRALVDGLLAVSGAYPRRGPARPVELTLVVHSDVRPWRHPPRCEFQYGEWLRPELERGNTPQPTANADLALLLTMVLRHSVVLFGPRPDELLAPVPHEDLLRALVAGVPDLLDELHSDTRNVVLTLARIWMTLATGTIGSKESAAGWVVQRLAPEHRQVPDRARAIHLGQRQDDWRDLLPHARRYADHVVGMIERLSGPRVRNVSPAAGHPCWSSRS